MFDLDPFLAFGRFAPVFIPLLVSTLAVVELAGPCVATRATRAAKPVPFLGSFVAFDRTEPITCSGDDWRHSFLREQFGWVAGGFIASSDVSEWGDGMWLAHCLPF